MSQLSEDLRGQLSVVASEISETLEERGGRIDVALDLDESFHEGTAKTALERSLVVTGVQRGVGRVDGLSFQRVGSGVEVIAADEDGHYHHLRVRRAKRNATGDLVVTASSTSALVVGDESSLFTSHLWVLAFLLDDHHQLREFLASLVVGFEDGKPGRLILGKTYSILTIPSVGGSPERFRTTDDDLDFPGDEEDGRGYGSF
jgi:hypothetical protein